MAERDDALDELVIRCLSRIESDGEPAIEALCAEQPQHAEALRRRLARLREMGLLGAPPSALPVERLGPFQLLERLGGGGMGVVYRALQDAPRREVALKVIRPDQLHFEGARLRFAREVETVARLQHPGVVPIHSVGEDGGVPWFAMELVQGRTLHQAIAALRGRDPATLTGRDLAAAFGAAADDAAWVFTGSYEEACLRLARQVAEALDHAHRRGVVHRDVKPSNVIVTPAGRAMLLDFGLASAAGEATLTRSGAQLGSLHWMSPEQAAGGAARLGPASDVYSLGVTLWELLALATPWPGKSDARVLLAIQEGRAAPLRQRNRALSWEAETVCQKAMEIDPARRYASAADFARDLGNALERRPIEARRAGAVRRLARAAARHPGSAAAIALLAVLLIGGPTFYAVQEAHALERISREHADVLRLSALQEIDDLEREAAALWPLEPAIGGALVAWRDAARALVGELPLHRAKLAELRARAFEPPGGGEARFATVEERWRHAQLAKLVAGLEALADPERGLLLGLHPEHGLSIERRLALLERLVEQTRDGSRARERWAQASDEIALDERYDALELEPQFGLLPLGPDPESGLHEFWHVASGSEPVRDPASGRLACAADAGIVLVLLPGGHCTLGAQASDPAAPRFDPEAKPDEALCEVELAPYFIAKHEMTQAQWKNATGLEPAHYGPRHGWIGEAAAPRHPVETVSYVECAEVLRRLDLCLPTEAQWEAATRGGTETRWWWGDTVEELVARRAENVVDEAAKRMGAPANWAPIAPWDDGFPAHAPVGSFAANPFGLHDTLGNVNEWCRDAHRSDVPFGSGGARLREGDGMRVDPEPPVRPLHVMRGGTFSSGTTFVRTTSRQRYTPDHKYMNVGLRPSREYRRGEETAEETAPPR